MFKKEVFLFNFTDSSFLHKNTQKYSSNRSKNSQHQTLLKQHRR